MRAVEFEAPIIAPIRCSNSEVCLDAQEPISQQLKDFAIRPDVKDSEIRLYCAPSAWYNNGKCEISVSHAFNLSHTGAAGSSRPVRIEVECPSNGSSG